MNRFRADLHNHTLLSPCGDIEMTPAFIVSTALRKGYDIIGITDHNTTLQGREIRRMVGDGEPYILCGVEITTKEEVHCLAFADSEESLDALQNFLDDSLPKIPNDEVVFGYQLAVNEAEEVIYEAPYLLISAIDRSVEEVAAFVASIGGIFIPAHIDKPQNSVISSWDSCLRTCLSMPWRYPPAATWRACWPGMPTLRSVLRHLSVPPMPIIQRISAGPSPISICPAALSRRYVWPCAGRRDGA